MTTSLNGVLVWILFYVIVDALSRSQNEISIFSLGVDLWGCILEAFPSDTWYQEVRVEVESRRTLDGRFIGYFLESGGLLWHLGCIYVLASGDLRTLILLEAHHAPYFSHVNIKNMYVDFRQLYFWVGMRHDVADFVSQCLECQRLNAKHQYLTCFL